VVLVLAPDRVLPAVRRDVAEQFARRFGAAPRSWIAHASSGVRMERFRR
jgi:hypothetical protein